MPDLRQQQSAFAAHLRDPAANPPPPGIEPRRMAIYRDLFFNNIAGLLAANFPVIRRTLGEDAWRALVRRFYSTHRSRTPLFPELAREFIRFLEQAPDPCDPPWLRELAHYEWIELAVQIDDSPVPAHDPAGDLLDGIPVRAPLAWPLAYRYAVHRIRADARPEAPGDVPTCLLVLRDAGGRVRFREITPVILQLLKAFGADDAPSGRTALRDLAIQAGADVERFVADGTALLQRLRDDGVLLGTRPRG